MKNYLTFGTRPILLLFLKWRGKKISNYKPINLCNFNYNIISKIMAERLKILLPNIIPKGQFDFVKGRFILDNIFLAQ